MTTINNLRIEIAKAEQEFLTARKNFLAFAGCRKLREMKKDPAFIVVTNEVAVKKSRFYNLQAELIKAARNEVRQSILN